MLKEIITRYFIIPVCTIGNLQKFFTELGNFFDWGHKFKKHVSFANFQEGPSHFLDVISASNDLEEYYSPFGKTEKYWEEIKLLKTAVQHFRLDALSLETINEIQDTNNRLGYFKKNNSIIDFIWYLICWVAKGVNVIFQINALYKTIYKFNKETNIFFYLFSLAFVMTKLLNALSLLDSKIASLGEMFKKSSERFEDFFGTTPLQMIYEIWNTPKVTAQRLYHFFSDLKNLFLYAFTTESVSSTALPYFFQQIWKVLMVTVNIQTFFQYLLKKMLPYGTIALTKQLLPTSQDAFAEPVCHRVHPALLNALAICFDSFIIAIQFQDLAKPTYANKLITFLPRKPLFIPPNTPDTTSLESQNHSPFPSPA